MVMALTNTYIHTHTHRQTLLKTYTHIHTDRHCWRHYLSAYAHGHKMLIWIIVEFERTALIIWPEFTGLLMMLHLQETAFAFVFSYQQTKLSQKNARSNVLWGKILHSRKQENMTKLHQVSWSKMILLDLWEGFLRSASLWCETKYVCIYSKLFLQQKK